MHTKYKNRKKCSPSSPPNANEKLTNAKGEYSVVIKMDRRHRSENFYLTLELKGCLRITSPPPQTAVQ